MKESEAQEQKFNQLMQHSASKEVALNDLESKLDRESKMLAGKKETISRLDDEIRQKNAEMDEIKTKAAKNEDIIANLVREVKEREVQLEAQQRDRLSKVIKRMTHMDLAIVFTRWTVCLYVSMMISNSFSCIMECMCIVQYLGFTTPSTCYSESTIRAIDILCVCAGGGCSK